MSDLLRFLYDQHETPPIRVKAKRAKRPLDLTKPPRLNQPITVCELFLRSKDNQIRMAGFEKRQTFLRKRTDPFAQDVPESVKLFAREMFGTLADDPGLIAFTPPAPEYNIPYFSIIVTPALFARMLARTHSSPLDVMSVREQYFKRLIDKRRRTSRRSALQHTVNMFGCFADEEISAHDRAAVSST